MSSVKGGEQVRALHLGPVRQDRLGKRGRGARRAKSVYAKALAAAVQGPMIKVCAHAGRALRQERSHTVHGVPNNLSHLLVGLRCQGLTKVNLPRGPVHVHSALRATTRVPAALVWYVGGGWSERRRHLAYFSTTCAIHLRPQFQFIMQR